MCELIYENITKNKDLFEKIHFENFIESFLPTETIKKLFKLADLSEEHLNDLRVRLELIDITEENLKKPYTRGKFLWVSQYNDKPTIDIYFTNKISPIIYFGTIFHEICHLKQYVLDKDNFKTKYKKEKIQNGYRNNKYEKEAREYAKLTIEQNKNLIEEILDSIPKLELKPTLTMDEIDVYFKEDTDGFTKIEILESIFVLVFSEEVQDSNFYDMSIALQENTQELEKIFMQYGGKTASELEQLELFKKHNIQCFGSNYPIYFIGKENAQKLADYLNEKYLSKNQITIN